MPRKSARPPLFAGCPAHNGFRGELNKPVVLLVRRWHAIVWAMIRTQVQLKERQLLRLRALAAERDLSVSELVRKGVDVLLDRMEHTPRANRARRAIAAAGRFRSGQSDVARRHDCFLVAAYDSAQE